MVDFVIFNELSLPLSDYTFKDQLKCFLEIIDILGNYNIKKIRMDKNFKEYEILNNISFQEFLGNKISDIDFKRRIISFITNKIIIIENPIIQENDINENDQIQITEYFFENISINSGLACADIFNSIALSFNTDIKWDNSNIELKKVIIENNETKEFSIQINHISKENHIEIHNKYFEDLENEIKLGIDKDNFWENREKYFKKFIFSNEIKDQIKALDNNIFKYAITILRNIETNRVSIKNINWSRESETVRNDPNLRNERMFTINNNKEFFEDHIKNLPNGYRIYFKEKDNIIYIGYIGKHLKTKKF